MTWRGYAKGGRRPPDTSATLSRQGSAPHRDFNALPIQSDSIIPRHTDSYAASLRNAVFEPRRARAASQHPPCADSRGTAGQFTPQDTSRSSRILVRWLVTSGLCSRTRVFDNLSWLEMTDSTESHVALCSPVLPEWAGSPGQSGTSMSVLAGPARWPGALTAGDAPDSANAPSTICLAALVAPRHWARR